MLFFSISNLSSHNVQTCEPWKATANRPALDDKEAYRAWCNDPATEHAFVSAFTGLQPALRVSETNAATHLCGLVLDYDAVPPSDPALILLNSAPHNLRPCAVSRTYSGNVRVYYQFEEPIPLFAPEIAKEFLKKVARELKLRKLLAGFEVEAMLDTSKYYEIGEDITLVGDGTATIPHNLLMAWMTDACKKHRWSKEGPVISIEDLRIEAEKKFPNRWPGGWGTFDIGSRGPRFWDESASDPTAIIVRESGVQYFSDGGGFQTWEMIFGAAFVRNWEDNRKGAAIVNLWYDGRYYWRKLATGQWAYVMRQDMILDLVVSKHLRVKSERTGVPSEVQSALFDIQNLKSVNRAAPFIFRPDGPYYYNGKRFLNVSKVRPIMPVSDLVDSWGEGFPWLAQFFDTLFDPVDQLDYFLAWLKHFYMGAVTQDPKRGLALFIAGPVGAGKTVLNKAVLGQLLGGRQDAGKFLLRGDQFNDQLFGAAMWCVDDEVTSTDPKQRSMFTQMVKKIVANDSFTYRAMYQSGVDMEWLGRVVVTMNDDPESLQMLPETKRNILDKIMLIKVKTPSVPYWPSDAQIAAELPLFGAFLRDWVVPVRCHPDNPRFGVSPYKHEGLLQAAGSTSVTCSFEELLKIWREEWFAAGGAGEGDPYWRGNPTALHQDVARNENLRPILDRSFSSATSIGMHLNKLLKRGVLYLTNPAHRTYVIKCP